MTSRFENLRREYTQGGLRRPDLLNDPIDFFNRWFEQVAEAGLTDPTAMVLATVSAGGQPSQRIVLLKGVSAAGFVFYTNTGSRKGQELAGNPRVSVLFPWQSLDRQVKICGRVESLPRTSAERYFHSRPRDSQLAAWASPQSQPIASRDFLTQRFGAYKEQFGTGEIPLPDGWGGYCVVPHEMEFWQGGAHRLHDCFRYQKTAGGGWQIERIAP